MIIRQQTKNVQAEQKGQWEFVNKSYAQYLLGHAYKKLLSVCGGLRRGVRARHGTQPGTHVVQVLLHNRLHRELQM